MEMILSSRGKFSLWMKLDLVLRMPDCVLPIR